MDPSTDLVDRFKLESRVLSDCTLNTGYRSYTNLEIINKRFTQRVTKRWIRIEELGAGNSSNVWLEIEQDGSARAVKKTPKWIYKWSELEYRREIAAMAALSKYKQYFVPIYGWYETPEDVYLAMEYFHLGDLEGYMDRQLSILQIKVIIRQLLEGLYIMHRDGFTHRDLKPQNIFVFKDNPYIWVKIGDFGVTKRVPQDGTSLRTETGTSGYVAPEVLGYHDQESSKYTNAVDLWSLGCICHRLLTMQPAFENAAKMIRYCSGGTKLPIEALRSDNDEDVAFVKMLLMVNPSERYTAERALQSTWFDSLRSQEPLHGAQYQSQSQDDLPCKIEASNCSRPLALVMTIVTAIIMAIVMASVGGWCTHLQLLIIVVLISTPLLAAFWQFSSSSGVPVANPQFLVILPEPKLLMSHGILVVFAVIALMLPCIALARGGIEPWVRKAHQIRDYRAT